MHKDDDACSQLLSLDVLLCWVNRLRLLSLQMTTSKTATAILELLQITKLVTWSISLKFPPLIWCCWPCWPIKKLDSYYIYVIGLQMTTSKTATAILESLQITELVTWAISLKYPSWICGWSSNPRKPELESGFKVHGSNSWRRISDERCQHKLGILERF